MNALVLSEKGTFPTPCAWCLRALQNGEVFTINLRVPPAELLEHYEGEVITFVCSKSNRDIPAFVCTADSQAKLDGVDVIIAACSEHCAQSVRLVIAREKNKWDVVE